MTVKKTIGEQIADLENTRAARVARMEEVMQKSMDEGRSTDEAEAEEVDTISGEMDSIDADIKRLKTLEKFQAQKSKPVDGKNTDNASQSRDHAVVKNTQKLEPGIEFARYAQALAMGKGNLHQSFEIAKNRFADNPRIVSTLKAAVEAGTTTDATWAAPLVDYNNFAGDFVEFLRPQTILGRMTGLRRVPFNVRITGQTSGGDAYWVGEGAPKPLTSFNFNAVNLRWSKVATIAVITEELARMSTPSAEALVRQSLADAVIARLDMDFIDPSKAAVADVSPASITNGVTPIPSSGTDADAIRADIRALWAVYIANNISPTSAVYIMSASTALALSMMQNALGQPEFSGVTMTGGSLGGVPVIVSEYVAQFGDTSGNIVILANQSDIFLADDGQVVLDASREASLQMLDNPTNNSGTGTGTSMVSMFQTNSIALRAERWINWQKRRPQAVAYLTGVNWA